MPKYQHLCQGRGCSKKTLGGPKDASGRGKAKGRNENTKKLGEKIKNGKKNLQLDFKVAKIR